MQTLKVRRITVWLLLIVPLALMGCQAGEPATPEAETAPLPLEDCVLSDYGRTIEARCGTLTVPENRAAPEQRQIALHVAVVPAVSRSPAPDPLFILVGGPGQAATEIYPALSTAFQRVHQDRDIVLVDQRGTGESHPLQCEVPDDAAFEQDELIDVLQACPETLDADLRFYTTEIAVEDLDAVRAALGYESVNLYGASYGTRVALTYLRRYPDRVRTALLDAVVSPDFHIYEHLSRDADRALRHLFDRCASDAGCADAFPDLETNFEALLARLKSEPEQARLPDPTTGQPLTLTLERDDVTGMVLPLLYAPELFALLPLDLHVAATEGNYAPLVAQVESAASELYLGMFYAVACTEDAPFLTGSDAPADETAYFGEMGETLQTVCEAWPQGTLPTDFNAPVTADAPVLLLSGEVDPITPPRYAEEVAAQLPNSLHLVAPGMGHGLITRGCVPQLAAEFVEVGALDALDAPGCVEEIAPPPFFLSYTGPQR